MLKWHIAGKYMYRRGGVSAARGTENCPPYNQKNRKEKIMEVLNDVNVKTISMVKLGANYYALKDEDAVRKSVLWEPEKALTKDMLKAYYQPSFYETLSAAALDINAETVGTGVATDAEQENVAVYTDENGSTVVVLLADVAENAAVTLEKDMHLRLNGKVLSFGSSGTYLKIDTTVSEGVIDGRVPGSMVVKTVAQETAVMERLLDLRAANSRVLGGAYQLNLANSSAASLAVMVRNGHFSGENCTIQATQNAGSGNLYGIAAYSPLSLQGCTVTCQCAGGLSRGVEVKEDVQNACICDCVIRAESITNTAVGFYPLCQNAVVRNSQILASNTGNSADNEVGKSTAIQQYADKLTVENCRLISSSEKTHTNCIYAYQGEYRIYNTEIRASSAENYAYALQNQPDAKGYIQDCICFADATSGETNASYAVGVLNYGKMTLENCSAYGTHSGMQLWPNSHTHVTGGTFEGVGHGGIYFSNMGGTAFIQNAKILNARYCGDFKSTFDYENQYHIAGMYIGNAENTVVSNAAVYLDNCLIDGSTGNAVVLRGTGGEQNNAIYMSNCEVTGGTIRIDGNTHKLYVGKACDVVSSSTKPECVVQTDAVYTGAPGMPEDMPAAEDML